MVVDRLPQPSEDTFLKLYLKTVNIDFSNFTELDHFDAETVIPEDADIMAIVYTDATFGPWDQAGVVTTLKSVEG